MRGGGPGVASPAARRRRTAPAVVADHFSIAFLHTLHEVAADLGDAGAQALAAGIDVELPTGRAGLGEGAPSAPLSGGLCDRTGHACER
jgi:hypothetical protein